MKKNKFLKLASGLLMLVLITCCAVSGTFAKYVTTGEANDTARVAKWGIEMSVTGDENSFSTTYGTTVASVNTDKVVAPGTDGTLFTFSINGTAEVDYALAISFNVVKEVKLVAGTYLDYTTANSSTDTFDLANDYYPIKYTVTKPDASEQTFNTLGELKTYLEDLSKATVDANTESGIQGTYTIAWSWAFTPNEQADTFLGHEGTQTISYEFSISATQID